MDKLPFDLNVSGSHKHKTRKKTKWKMRGVKWETQEEFDIMYNRYIYSSECELCHNKYKNRFNRCLDHCHDTGKFRNIVCRRCNTLKKDVVARKESTTGEKNITKCKNKEYKSGFCYCVEFSRNGVKIYHRRNTTLEKAIEYRDKFIAENPTIFT
mgnify:FL=1